MIEINTRAERDAYEAEFNAMIAEAQRTFTCDTARLYLLCRAINKYDVAHGVDTAIEMKALGIAVAE